MRVSVFQDDLLIWEHEFIGDQMRGYANCAYLSDGTQPRIVAALRRATTQALGQSGLLDVGDARTDVGLAAAQIEDGVPAA